VFIEYSFIGNRVGAWVTRGRTIHFVSLPCGRQSARRLMDRFLLSAGRRRAMRSASLLDQLERMLIEPLVPYLPDKGELVIIPDEMLARLPFAALLRPSGRYLLDDYTISVAPSASLYLHHASTHSESNTRLWRVLVVANPSSKVRAIEAPLLQGPEREGAFAVMSFPASRVLSGLQAVSSSPLLHERFDVYHFAGHWDWRDVPFGGDSRLDPSALHPGPGVQLVVLAACRTALDPIRRKAFRFGMAGPILNDGIPAVIASLWSVNDQATSELMIRFYRELRGGRDAANALRTAQLELLRGPKKAFRNFTAWGGFQLYGYGGVRSPHRDTGLMH
jgi:CHAT domain-containing protein